MAKQNNPKGNAGQFNESGILELADGQLESIVGGASQTIGFAPILPTLSGTISKTDSSGNTTTQTVGFAPILPTLSATVSKS